MDKSIDRSSSFPRASTTCKTWTVSQTVGKSREEKKFRMIQNFSDCGNRYLHMGISRNQHRTRLFISRWIRFHWADDRGPSMCQSLHNEPSNLSAWGLRRIRLESNNRYSEDVTSDIIDWERARQYSKIAFYSSLVSLRCDSLYFARPNSISNCSA